MNSYIPPGTIQPIVAPPEHWKMKFPTIISGVLAFLQFFVTIAIIGCEIGSVLIDMITATIYVGFWSSPFFTAAWISLSISACCCRNRGCAMYTLIIQCISLFFAACVIGFDAYFLVHQKTCFFPSSTCESTGLTRGVYFSQSNFDNIKIRLIIGQLAAGGVMFLLCLVYIAIFFITIFRVYNAKSSSSIYPHAPQAPNVSSMIPTGPDGMIIAPPVANVRSARIGSPLYHRPTMIVDNGDGRTNDLLCPTCSTMMSVSVKKRPPQ